MYCDRRLGIEQWFNYTPSDAEMRIPDDLRDCTCFLFVITRDGQKKYSGTGFFMHFYRPEYSRVFTYLVTAKHCVTKAFAKVGNLYARINNKDGSSEDIQLDQQWACSPDPGVDIAVCPFNIDRSKHKQGTIDFQSSAHEENRRANAIGIGNEVLAIGLFTLHHGTHRNVPIVRQGILSSMPEEPITDGPNGLPYKAYLAELQAIAGLSGSPVFVHVPALQLLGESDDTKTRDRMKRGHPAGFLYLLGVIRSHFEAPLDIEPSAEERTFLHTGIATVTPVEEVLEIVNKDERLAKQRQQILQADREKAGREVLDTALANEEDSFTKADFEAALKKVSRRIQPSQSDEEK